MAKDLPAVLAVLTGLLSCFVLGKYSNYQKQFLMRTHFYTDNTICRATLGLNRAQMDLCFKQPDVTKAALKGLQMAIEECQHQFQNDRWNCSSLNTRTKNPYTSAIYQKGFRETAFAYALSSAGVVISIAKACSQGLLLNCGCDTHKYKNRKNASFKWTGCSNNLQFELKFAKRFLDVRESGDDLHSQINLHNNQVGRMIVAENMVKKCRCHGLSGSCELKTCWKAVQDLRIVGKLLKEKYKLAAQVDQINLANRNPQINAKPKKRKQKVRLKQWKPRRSKRGGLRKELIYYEKSPNFCEKDSSLDVWGTSGRFCNRTHNEEGSCAILCCGRGYNVIQQTRQEMCNCKFLWCCAVECQNCTVDKEIIYCK